MRILPVLIGFLILTTFTLSYGAERESALTNYDKAIVRGTISDALTGEGLAGVAIRFEGINQTVYTDFDGNYQLTLPFEGKYDITVCLASYHPQSVKQVRVQYSSEIALNLALRRN